MGMPASERGSFGGSGDGYGEVVRAALVEIDDSLGEIRTSDTLQDPLPGLDDDTTVGVGGLVKVLEGRRGVAENFGRVAKVAKGAEGYIDGGLWSLIRDYGGSQEIIDGKVSPENARKLTALISEVGARNIGDIRIPNGGHGLRHMLARHVARYLHPLDSRFNILDWGFFHHPC